MFSGIIEFFDSGDFLPHGICLLWRPEILWLHIGSDAAIALAYYSIPTALFYFAYRRPDLSNRRVLYLFVAFIAACGTTHLASIWTLWHPDYALEGVIKAGTATVSLVTALVLWIGMPHALALPSRQELALANSRLEELNADLERRVRERTEALERNNAQLQDTLRERDILFRELHHRVKNNLQVVSSLLSLEVRDLGPEYRARIGDLQQRLRAMSLIHRQLYQGEEDVQVDLADYLRELIGTIAETYVLEPSRVDWQLDLVPIRIDIEVATPVSLIVNEVLANVAKHAFPDLRTGRMAVRLEEDEGMVTLVIRDNGIGLGRPGAAAGRSLGMRLIGLLAGQIGGTAEFQPQAEGTEFRLHFPQQGSRPEADRAAMG